jgi:5-methylcytosine-specific restriction endonuclease McrA
MRVKRIFCSKKCHDEAQKITVIKICRICKKEFSVRPCEYERIFTCSRECFLKAKCNKGNSNWKGGTATDRRPEMSTVKYKNWKYGVFKRDNYTCQHCGVRGGNLNAHHIKSWTYFPEFRYLLKNGITLCLKCHRKTYKLTFVEKK